MLAAELTCQSVELLALLADVDALLLLLEDGVSAAGVAFEDVLGELPLVCGDGWL